MKNNKGLSLKQRSSFYGYLFISPWLIGFLLFFITPVITSVTFAFNKITPTKQAFSLDYVGFKNFVFSFKEDTSFLKFLYASLIQLVTNVPIILVFSFFIALLLKDKFRGIGIFKGIFFLPIIMSSGLFVLLQTNFGNYIQSSNLEATINNVSSNISFLQSMNMEKYLIEIGLAKEWINYITGPINAIYSVISSSGIQIFIFLAGLNSISPSLYEACYIEGASNWETFWEITFPMMIPMILVNTIYSIVDTFTALTNQVMTYTYSLAFKSNNFGVASAMSWTYFLILAVIMGLVGYFISRKSFYYT